MQPTQGLTVYHESPSSENGFLLSRLPVMLTTTTLLTRIARDLTADDPVPMSSAPEPNLKQSRQVNLLRPFGVPEGKSEVRNSLNNDCSLFNGPSESTA